MDTHLPLERKNRKGILGWEKPKAWLMDEDRCRVRDTSCTTVSLAFPPPAASLHFIFLHRVDLMSFDTCEDRGAPGGFVAHRLKAPPFLRWHAFQPREREKGREGEGKGVFDRKTLTPVAKKEAHKSANFSNETEETTRGSRPYVFLPILPRFFFPNPFPTRRTTIIIFAFDRFIQFCYSSLEAKILTNHRRYCLLLPFPNNRSFVPFVFTTDTRIVGSEEDLNPGGGSCQGAIIDDGALMTAS